MPPFRFPFFYRPPYYNYNKVPYYSNQSKPQQNFHDNSVKHDFQHNSQSHVVSTPHEKERTHDSSPDNYFFEIFSLKLFFDDILLICIIFFLYQEGVKDNELFISLILLLLS